MSSKIHTFYLPTCSHPSLSLSVRGTRSTWWLVPVSKDSGISILNQSPNFEFTVSVHWIDFLLVSISLSDSESLHLSAIPPHQCFTCHPFCSYPYSHPEQPQKCEPDHVIFRLKLNRGFPIALKYTSFFGRLPMSIMPRAYIQANAMSPCLSL